MRFKPNDRVLYEISKRPTPRRVLATVRNIGSQRITIVVDGYPGWRTVMWNKLTKVKE